MLTKIEPIVNDSFKQIAELAERRTAMIAQLQQIDEKLEEARVCLISELCNACEKEKEPTEELPEVEEDIPVDVADQEEPSETKKPVNKQEIYNLYNAGWTVGKIADEVGLSWATVDYHLKKAGFR